MMELTVKSCSQVKKFNSIKLYNFYLTNFLHLIPFRKKMIQYITVYYKRADLQNTHCVFY